MCVHATIPAREAPSVHAVVLSHRFCSLNVGMCCDLQGDDDTPAMPSMSGATTASTYADSKQHPSLSDKGKSSPTSTSASSAYDHPSKGAAQDRIKSSEKAERAGGGSSATKGTSSETSSGSMSQENKDNMGGGSSSMYSQGPRKSGGAAQGGNKESQGDASTPAMPSMSGTTTATTYSDSSKHRSLTGKGSSSKGGVTSNPASRGQMRGQTTWAGEAQPSILKGPGRGAAAAVVTLLVMQAHLLCPA